MTTMLPTPRAESVLDPEHAIVIRQRMEGDHLTCRQWVRGHGHCNALTWLRDGLVPATCPQGHPMPWYGTKTAGG